MLQGVTMLQVEAMPICDFLKSRLVKPTGVEHGAAGGALGAIDDDCRMPSAQVRRGRLAGLAFGWKR